MHCKPYCEGKHIYMYYNTINAAVQINKIKKSQLFWSYIQFTQSNHNLYMMDEKNNVPTVNQFVVVTCVAQIEHKLM